MSMQKRKRRGREPEGGFECMYGLGECVVAPRIIDIIESAVRRGVPDSIKAVAPDIARAFQPFAEWAISSPEIHLVQILPRYCAACPVVKKAVLEAGGA